MRNGEFGMRDEQNRNLRLFCTAQRSLSSAQTALHTPHPAFRIRRGGFTLIELLVVMGIIAVLASMLLPAMFSVSRQAKISNAEALLKLISVSLDVYSRDYTSYPPDFIPRKVGATDTLIYNFDGTTTGTPPIYTKVPLTTDACPAEALYYFLCHRYLSLEHPMLRLRGKTEASDINSNAIPEIVDPWGRPLIYNRPPFPACDPTYFNLKTIKIGSDTYTVAATPYHNSTTYDLYSVGPDGQTGANDLPEYKYTSAADTSILLFWWKAMDASNDGEGDDDIRNWFKTAP